MKDEKILDSFVKETLTNVKKTNIPLNFDRRTFIEHCLKDDKNDMSKDPSRKASRVSTRTGTRAVKKQNTAILNGNDDIIGSIKMTLANINRYTVIDFRKEHKNFLIKNSIYVNPKVHFKTLIEVYPNDEPIAFICYEGQGDFYTL